VVLVPLNTSLPSEAINQACKATDVKHLIATTDILQALQLTLLIDGLWISLDKSFEGAISLSDCTNEAYLHFEPTVQDSMPLILTMTSGSTGNPKPIILQQKTKLSRADAAIKTYKVSNKDKTLIATPLYHSLAERLAFIALLTGGTLIIMARFSPSEWIRTIAAQSISFTIAVSSQLSQIAQYLDEEAGQQSMKSLRCLVSSSALLDTATKEKLVSTLNCEFHECYGASEVAIATNLNAEEAKLKINSVGKALPNVKVKILKDDNTLASPNEAGEIICKTPMCFSGYYGAPKLTNDALFGDYFRTGDIGKLDEDGFLYFLGRKKEIIITGGINVYPSDIESIVLECHTVKESAVFPYPDEKLGEIVAIALVPTQLEQFKLRKIRLHCATRLADYQQPRKFFIVDALPRNSLGKIMKHAILSEIMIESGHGSI